MGPCKVTPEVGLDVTAGFHPEDLSLLGAASTFPRETAIGLLAPVTGLLAPVTLLPVRSSRASNAVPRARPCAGAGPGPPPRAWPARISPSRVCLKPQEQPDLFSHNSRTD